MLIDFSLLNGTRATLECDPNETIANVIPRIVRAFHLENYNNIQLIYKGKKLIENDEIKNLGYIQSQVVIVRALGEKPTEPTSNSVPPLPQPNTPNTSATSVQPSPKQDNAPNTDRPPPPNNIESAPHQQTNITHKTPPVLLPDSEMWEANLQSLIEMGFDEDLSTRALIQAFNQPDRAVELITNGQVSPTEQGSNENSPSSSINPPQTSTTNPNNTITPPPSTVPPQTNSSTQMPGNSNQNTQDSSQNHLPHPHPHPLPDVQSHSSPDDTNNRPRNISEFMSRIPRGRHFLANSPPTDPTLEADEDFDLIRQTLIDHPMIIDNIISIIQRNNADNEDPDNPQNGIGPQISSNSKLLLRLFGIRDMETITVPETYTEEDIAIIRRLHGLGQFSWQQVIDAYEDSDKNEDYAEAILISLGD